MTGGRKVANTIKANSSALHRSMYVAGGGYMPSAWTCWVSKRQEHSELHNYMDKVYGDLWTVTNLRDVRKNHLRFRSVSRRVEQPVSYDATK